MSRNVFKYYLIIYRAKVMGDMRENRKESNFRETERERERE